MKPERIRKLLYAADILLAAGLAWTVVSVVRTARAPAADSAVSAPAANPAAPGALSDQEFSFIIDSGAIVPKSVPVEIPAEVPPSFSSADFGYTLIGTAVHETVGFAFLEGPNRVQKVGAIGELIGDARLVRVTDDEAFFERAGQTFSLKREVRVLKGSDVATPLSPGSASAGSRFAQTSPAAPQAVAQVASAQAGAPGVQQPTGDAAESSGEEEEEDPDQLVMTRDQYKTYLENVGKYMNEIIVLSHYGPDGQLDGLLLAKVPKESEASKRGLKEGDIIKSVQGIPVTDTGTASKAAWDAYKNEDYTLELEIIRNGEEETLMYEIWPE